MAQWFTVNGQAFEIDEGSPTWDRLTGSGIWPDGHAEPEDDPAEPAPVAVALSKADLVAIAVELGVPNPERLNKALLAEAIAEAEAEAAKSVGDPGDQL